MADTPDTILTDILAQIDFHPTSPLDFQHGGADVVRVLTAAATYFNTMAVAEFGGRQGKERQAGLVEQVIAAAFQTYGSTDPHPEPFEKAAMLLRGITAGHPFQDGNKRTGFLVAAFYLEQVERPLAEDFSVAEAETLCLQISAGQLRDIEEITRQLRQLWQES
jgi:death-on-curing protein